jgi:hypothetical protein
MEQQKLPITVYGVGTSPLAVEATLEEGLSSGHALYGANIAIDAHFPGRASWAPPAGASVLEARVHTAGQPHTGGLAEINQRAAGADGRPQVSARAPGARRANLTTNPDTRANCRRAS